MEFESCNKHAINNFEFCIYLGIYSTSEQLIYDNNDNCLQLNTISVHHYWKLPIDSKNIIGIV